MMLRFLVLVVPFAVGGCGENKPKCVEGQSSACACPSGGTGAQVCSANGAFGPCSCVPVGKPPGSADFKRCSIDALNCAGFSSQGLTGWQLHKLVFDARNAKRFDEAICLAQNSSNAADKVLAGASHYEASYAWDGLGCRENAVGAIEESVRVRPSDKNGWKETCARCGELKASCALCEATKTERIACPKNERLVADLGSAMLARAPSEATWTTPSIGLCVPIGLPQPGWYVVGRVAQEAPDRDILFHLAVDAGTSKVLAMSEGDQRSIREVCDLKVRTVADHAGAPSSVVLDEDCGDSMNRAYKYKLAVTIKPPKIVVAGRASVAP